MLFLHCWLGRFRGYAWLTLVSANRDFNENYLMVELPFLRVLMSSIIRNVTPLRDRRLADRPVLRIHSCYCEGNIFRKAPILHIRNCSDSNETGTRTPSVASEGVFS